MLRRPTRGALRGIGPGCWHQPGLLPSVKARIDDMACVLLFSLSLISSPHLSLISSPHQPLLSTALPHPAAGTHAPSSPPLSPPAAGTSSLQGTPRSSLAGCAPLHRASTRTCS